MHLERARLLIGQDRYGLAEEQLRLAMAESPDDPIAHALLALCVLKREDYKEATQLARTAVHLGPDIAYTHFIQAAVLYERRRYQEALAPLGEALRLDPTDANFHGLAAGIEYHRQRWRETLAAAERGLAHDPHHEQCASLRSMALVQLGKFDHATAASGASLAQSPESALTHNTRGWTMLTQGYHKEALEHFREALRLDPTMDSARTGVVHALKARYWPYRLLLSYYYYMGRATKTYRWVFIIGLLVGVRVVRSVSAANPVLAPIGALVVLAYVGMVYFTWAGIPISNVFLRFNRYGRYALSRDETVVSNWVAGCLVAAVCSVIVAIAIQSLGFLILGAVFLGLLLAISMVYTAEGGRRTVFGIATALIAIAGIGGAKAGIVSDLANVSQSMKSTLNGFGVMLVPAAVLGVFALSWIANVSATREQRL